MDGQVAIVLNEARRAVAGGGARARPSACIARAGARFFDVGGADGKLGLVTRVAVKQMQVNLGLPADSCPTIELLERLRTVDWLSDNAECSPR